MKKLFINQHEKIRNGWWIALFIGLIVATQPLYRWITTNLRALHTPELMVDIVSPLLLLLVTFTCVRLYKQNLSDAGLSGTGRWWLQLGAGTAIGGLWLLAVALPLWLIGGVSFSINDQASASILFVGLYSFLLGALLEELLHRGFIFQRLIDGLGFTLAQVLMALVFAFGHLDNPEMDGLTMVIASLDLALASLILGFAYYRTKSLALPLGLHLGWNWVQGTVMGFNVSGNDQPSLLQAHLGDLPTWISGGAFGLEGGILSLTSSVIVLVLLWRWQGTSQQQKISDHSDNLLQSA